MKKILIGFSILLLFTPLLLSAQHLYSFNVSSFPDSCEVRINDSLIGFTPIKINWNFDYKKYYLFQFVLKKSGYNPLIIATYPENDQPRSEKNNLLTANLEKIRYKSDSIIDEWLALDKVIIEAKSGEKVGELNNKGDIKPFIIDKPIAIATSEFNELADEELTRSGYRTKAKPRLFANEVGEEEPQFLLGAELKKLEINYLVLDSIESNGVLKNSPVPVLSCNLEMQWQVYSRKKRSVILRTSTKGQAASFSYIELEKILKDAVRDALINLGFDTTLRNTIRSGMSSQSYSLSQIKKITLTQEKTETYPDYAAMIQKKLLSCVTIFSSGGHGSGFIISTEGHILTNYHVIDGEKELTIKFENGFEFPAEVISFDEEYDVALLKIKGSGFKGLPLNTNMAGVGTDVTAIGTPAKIELGQTVTKGIISGKREIEGKIFYQTDVSVSPGNSGGPLINAKGEVIGIITWGLRGDGIQGLNFAIPISVALEKLGITFTP